MSLTPREYSEKILNPLTEVTIGMEQNGLPFNPAVANAIKSRAEQDIKLTTDKLNEWSKMVDYVGPEMPPNWNSRDQLTYFLHTPLGLNLPPSPYWGEGRVDLDNDEWKTDDRALLYVSSQNLEAKPGIDLLRELRWEKRVVGYCQKWLDLAVQHDNGWWYLHPAFGLASDRDTRPGAVTGRFAIKNPPLQQVPAHEGQASGVLGDIPLTKYGLKTCFEAPPGYSVIEVDFSQLEVVILAHICHRLFGATILRDKMAPGRDVHSETAQYVFGKVLGMPRAIETPLALFKKLCKDLRDLVKALRYGLNYGKGAYGFGTTLFNPDGTILGEEKAQEFIDAMFLAEPEVPQYQQFIREYIRENEGIISLMGKWCPLPTANSRKEWERNRAWRRALNYPMQAGGQEIAALSMISTWFCQKLRRLGFELCLQIHDSLVGIVPTCNAEEAIALVSDHMKHSVELDCYLDAEGGFGPNLGEAK